MEGNKKRSRFFLGANSPNGFFSLYDKFTNPEDNNFTWILKGGAGCGKSSFMKKVAAALQERNLDIEYIHCSSSPDSLDGIYIPQLQTIYLDGTAPHTFEPKYPGAASMYLDLGRFYDRNALKNKLDKIAEIINEKSTLYQRAYASISASAALDIRRIPDIVGDEEKNAIIRRARGSAHRELRSCAPIGQKKYRMISGFTYKGTVFMAETISALCEKVYALDNEYGLAEYYLREIECVAERSGHEAILCLDPLFPERLEAVIIPGLSLGFVAREIDELETDAFRHIRLDAMANRAAVRKKRTRLRISSKFRAAMLEDAQTLLAEAKELHDKLEEIYNPHVDFDGVYAEADRHIEMLLNQVT